MWMVTFRKQYAAFNIPGQNPFYKSKKVFKNTKILKLENIDRDWKVICDQLGIKMEIQKSNQTDHMRPKINELYTRETSATIAKIYEIDFNKFNYSLDL